MEFLSQIRINGQLLQMVEAADGYARVTLGAGRGSVTVDGQQAKEALASALPLLMSRVRRSHEPILAA